jgi:predicted RNA polymerase sigma factor
VQEAFCRALEIWSFHGIPPNPSAWLMATAKNHAIDVLRRERTARTFAPEFGRLLDTEWTLVPAVEEVFRTHSIEDDQLRMMFSCCHPKLREDARVALILHILCGFSVSEVAGAFVAGNAATRKRITRAKEVLARSTRLFDVTAPVEFSRRLPDVQRALYLLFSEGYHGASPESSVRIELCREAMRLTAKLLQHPHGATPATLALAALMSLNAARLPGRVDSSGHLNALSDQDRSKWDRELLAEGLHLMELSASGTELSEYHVEAAIASIHGRALGMEDTDWQAIVSLYDTLMKLRLSPILALNRAIAVAQNEGPERGLAEIASIANIDRLAAYPFYPAAIGELQLRRGMRREAADHFRKALALARNPIERHFYDQRARICEEPLDE